MKIRTDFVTNSSSSSFVLEIGIELTNGECIRFLGRGSCGEGTPGDFGELEMTVSPKQLGNADSVQALVDLLRSGVVDAGFWRKKLRIMDERDTDRKKEADGAHARSAPVAASYDRAVDFIRQVERIPDMDAIQKITVSGNEHNRQNYLRTYVYDRASGAYTKVIKGSEFEKNGGSGGDLRFSDEAQAVDPHTIERFRYTEDIHFLNFRNRSFVTTGFTNAENKSIEQEIIKRGGTVEAVVRKSTYCLIANEDYNRTTEKYDSALLFNSGADLFYGNWIKPKEPDPNSKIIYIISKKMLETFLALPEGTCLNPSQPPYYIHGKRLVDVSARAEELDLSDTGITNIDEQSFYSCQKIRRLTLPLEWFPNGCFVNTDIDELRFTHPVKNIKRKGFGDRPLPKIRMPLYRIGDCKTPESKQALINCFLEEWTAGNSVDPDLQSGYDDYLRSQKKRYYENETALRYLAARGLLTKKDALDLAQTARESGNEALAAALEQGAATASAAPKKEKSATAAKDKLWSTKKLPDGTLMLRLYKGTDADIVVPAQLKGLPVTQVSYEVFLTKDKSLSEEQKEARKHIRSITVSEGIRCWGTDQYGRSMSVNLSPCPALRKISFPESLQETGGLVSIHPDTELIVPNAYYGLKNAFYGAPFENVIVPEGVTAIGEQAFYGCESNGGSCVRSITLPNSIVRIGASAFGKCIKLETVIFPEKLELIGESAFWNCESLKSVDIPSGIIRIERHTFSWCKSLESVKIPEGVRTIGEEAFEYCDELKTVLLPEGLTEIEDNAFYCCGKLTSIEIPASVRSIGKEAFYKFCFGNDAKTEICGTAGSYAEQYAKENGLRFKAIAASPSACEEIRESCTELSGDGNAQTKEDSVQSAIEPSDRPYHAESYEDYICFLKNTVITNKGRALSDAEAEQFIIQYNLDTDWGITLEDIKNDMEKIVKKAKQ